MSKKLDKLHSNEVENSILGLILKKPDSIKNIIGFLLVEDFYLDENKIVFKAMENCYEDKRKITKDVLLDYLDSKDNSKSRKDWLKYLAFLIINSGLESNLEQYLKILREKTQARKIEKSLEESIELVNNEVAPIQTIIENIEEKILNATREGVSKGFESIDSLLGDFETKMKSS